MTIHKLTAGSGYEYLTRQVAAQDSTELGTTPLADYYAAKGEAPGRWAGNGLDGLDGVAAGDTVAAEHMGRLFGSGEHPVTGQPLGRPPRADGVAGFDLTFSPVKSVSVLWAVGSPTVARAIEDAHDAAVADALAYVEREVLFTREGADGVRQVETRGLVAAAFRHRDSRAGDPDLHTHVAVANKVQARESGKWLTVYGALLFRYAVAISETYNTALEARLHESLGVQFADRASAGGRRTVREVVGVDEDLCRRWSRRGDVIDDRERELVANFTHHRGRAPLETERLALVQRANLETRAPKHEPRAETEQRATWQREAADVLGGAAAVGRMVRTAIRPLSGSAPATARIEPAVVRAIAAATVTELEVHRATWQSWHLRAEAERQVRASGDGSMSAATLPDLVDAVVVAAKEMTVLLTPDRDPLTQATTGPQRLRRSDGTSVYRHTGADHYTSQRILDAEERIVRAAGLGGDFSFGPDEIEVAIRESAAYGVALNRGQQELIRAMAGSPRRVRLALAPAGTGKTTAVQVLTRIWTSNGYDAIGIAPSAAASAVLREATGIATDTLAKVDWELLNPDQSGRDGLSGRINAGTLVVIDEAGLADTLTLDRIIAHCVARGAIVRLLGDDQQLAAVGAGGTLRDIASCHGAERLDEAVRFVDPAEAEASLDLREGDPATLGFYLDRDRVHAADQDSTVAEVLAAWREDRATGRDSLMLAPTRDLVADLNRQARTEHLGGVVPPIEVELADGNRASVGDTVLTRHNDRHLRVSDTDWVKNGDRWIITRAHRGALTVRHTMTALRAELPASYVAEHVDLGYASTVHAAQGITADVVHGIVDGREDRQLLYTMLTRGRHENHAHVVTDLAATGECDQEPLPGLDEQLTASQILDRVISRDGAAVSATTTLRRGMNPAARLRSASTRYLDAVVSATQQVVGSGWQDAIDAAGEGPLPWLPAIPTDVIANERWSRYVAATSEHVATSARELVGHLANAELTNKRPSWAARHNALLGDLRDPVALWRAAQGVRDEDRRPTGPPVRDLTAARYQRRLLRQIQERYDDSTLVWKERIIAHIGRHDDRTIDVARLLDRLEHDGHDAGRILERAVRRGPLPEGHASSALVYRIRRIVAGTTGPRQPNSNPELRSPEISNRATRSDERPGLGL